MKTLLILTILILGIRIVTSCSSDVCSEYYNVMVEVEYNNGDLDTFALDHTELLNLSKGDLYVTGVGILRSNVRRFDYIKKQGPWEGYTTITFKDGSTFTYKFQGASSSDPGAAKLLKGKGEFIKGTGRFEGIKGQLSLEGRFVTPFTKDKTKGDNWVEVTGTYTLPSK